MAKKPKTLGGQIPVPRFMQQMGSPAALSLQQSLNDLLVANPNLSTADLVQLLRNEINLDAQLRGARLNDLSGEAAAFAEQLAQQARGGGVAGVIEPPVRQRELYFTPDNSRPLYLHPRPLSDAIDAAAGQGVPWGASLAEGNYAPRRSDVAVGMQNLGDDFIRQLQDSLIADGIPGAEVVPLSQGVYSTAFTSPLTDEVVKFTLDGPSQYASNADGVWGVLSPRRVGQIPGAPGFAYSIYPRADLGRATYGDRDALQSAFRKQGYWWRDAHMGNMGMLPGSEYRPVVIDAADVSPDRTVRSVSFPFVPPTGPGAYNWLIPALAAGGTTALATLGGQQQAEAATGTRYRPPSVPKLPPPYAPTLRGNPEDYPPDWYTQKMQGYYSRVINQMNKVDREWERLAAAGDWERADALDAQREQLLETLESQLQDIDEDDPSFYEKSEEEDLYGRAENPGSVDDDLRAAYGQYVAGNISREDLVERLRGAANPVGSMDRPWGEGKQYATVNDVPEDMLIDAAKDLYDSRQAIIERQRNAPGRSVEQAIRFLRNVAPVAGAAALTGQAMAGEGTMGSQGGLPQPTGQDPFFNPPQRYGYPAEQSPGITMNPGGTLTMDASSPSAVMAVGSDGSAAVAPEYEGPGYSYGGDFSMAISPDEWRYWYENKGSGYGGEQHKRFAQAVEQTMDIPSIPEEYIAQVVGSDPKRLKGIFPGYEGGDMTPRMFLSGMPHLMILSSMSGFQEEVASGVRNGPYAQQLERLARPGSDKELVADTIAEFAGFSRNRDNAMPAQAAQMVLAGLQSGVTGGPFAERDEVTRSEDARLRRSFAREGREGESEFYVTPGGQQNYRREASLQLLRTLQDGAFAPPGMTSMDYVGNRLFDQTVGNIQRIAGDEYNPRAVPGFGRADWRADNLMNTSAPQGRIAIALDLYGRTPQWARMSDAQARERDTANSRAAQVMREADGDAARAAGVGDIRQAMLTAGAGLTASKDARIVGYRQINPDAVDRFDTGTAHGLSNVLWHNQSFTPAQYAQWAAPLLGNVYDKLAAGGGGWSGRELFGISPGDGSNRVEALGGGVNTFLRQQGRDMDSVRPVRGDRESESQYDRRQAWWQDKKQGDRDYRSAYWGPYSADLANNALGGDAFGKKFDRTFLSPTADFVANFGQDFVSNPYNWPTLAGGAAIGGAGGAVRAGLSGIPSGAASGFGRALVGELVDEGREEAALQAGGGMLDFRPQTTNAYARDYDAPQDQWRDGQAPQLDPLDPDYWKKFNRAYQYRQGQTAGYNDRFRRGLLD